MVTLSLIGFTIIVLASSDNDSSNIREISSTPTPKAQELTKQVEMQQASSYEKLSYKELSTIESFIYLYSGSDKSEEHLKSVVEEIRKNNCKKPCNIALFDDKKAADLDSEMRNIRNEREEKEWKRKNYIYVADHFPAMLEFEGVFFYYPYKDWLYDSLK